MNAQNFTAMTPEWITQLADPKIWQEWAKHQQMQSIPANAVGELGKLINPTVAAQLQNDYMREFSALCQDMMTSKVPAITDKRFASPAWQSNPMIAFNVAAYLLNGRFLMAMADNGRSLRPRQAKGQIHRTTNAGRHVTGQFSGDES